MSQASGDSQLKDTGYIADEIAATNIIITLQTLRMVVAGTGESSVSQRCEIAGNLLDAISNVPTAYIYASSAPVVSPDPCPSGLPARSLLHSYTTSRVLAISLDPSRPARRRSRRGNTSKCETAY